LLIPEEKLGNERNAREKHDENLKKNNEGFCSNAAKLLTRMGTALAGR
jgi:hypothetical protein